MEKVVSPEYVPATKKVSSFSEDWVVVFLGFAIILLSLIGVRTQTPGYDWATAGDLYKKIFTGTNVTLLGFQFLFVFIIALAGAFFTGKPLRSFIIVFPVIYIITIVAIILAGNNTIKSLNLEAVIFSLLLGLIIGNLFSMPRWFRGALSTELFVKIGLIILGTSIIFGDILKAGAFGLLQALIVVISVWYFAYWLCTKLKIDKELTMMIASAVSICGVSAAIATAGAIKGDTKKLSYIISLVLITAIPMMVGMPYIAKFLGLSQEVTGAWLGGTIDTTGAVVASGTLVGETALKISTIVKFSQNVLLGVAAFAISVYWTYAKNSAENIPAEKPTLQVIWDRFPKFVLGFIAASLLFSFLLTPAAIADVKGGLKNIQSLWFVLAFTSIGLETNFSDLLKTNNRKPLYAFLIAQSFNIIITLLVAFLLFRNTVS
jgi:uncharacterized integral membrane protein (TIGR00698 family)